MDTEKLYGFLKEVLIDLKSEQNALRKILSEEQLSELEITKAAIAKEMREDGSYDLSLSVLQEP